MDARGGRHRLCADQLPRSNLGEPAHVVHSGLRLDPHTCGSRGGADCRQYTWKEDVETRVKRATVIPPKQYKRRFRDALHRYFMASIEKYATDDGRIEELPPAAQP